MIKVDDKFITDYLLDDCDDCPENKNGECVSESHCFEVKSKCIECVNQVSAIKCFIENCEKLQADFPEDKQMQIGFKVACYDQIVGAINNHLPDCRQTNIPHKCTSCIKDCTDACPRGAGRAVDDEICDEYLKGE